jgi:trans-2,3-dihydro-3-hydroxyanthranilate isomerase
MREYHYQLLNVFAETTFGGNPLCVFEDGRGLTDDEMQSLALQFNLSETTFLLPSTVATKRVRIFTPTFEMAFAGHPTLGSAHVVRTLANAVDTLTLEMKAGIIHVQAAGDVWTLKAGAATTRDFTMPHDEIASMLGLDSQDVLPGARWVNTGTEQLIIPLASAEAVVHAAPDSAKLRQVSSDIGRAMAYIFADNGNGALQSRFFFMKHGSIVEDPGTGSATANLGAWMLHQGRAPCTFAITQGVATGKTCHLQLRVDDQQQIFVSGKVIELGRGTIKLS